MELNSELLSEDIFVAMFNSGDSIRIFLDICMNIRLFNDKAYEILKCSDKDIGSHINSFAEQYKLGPLRSLRERDSSIRDEIELPNRVEDPIESFNINWSVKSAGDRYYILSGRMNTLSDDTLANIDSIKNYYENIIALMPGHVYWMDKDGYYLGCNDQQAKSAGLAHRKEIYKKINKDLPWNLHKHSPVNKLNKINAEVIEEGVPITLEESRIKEDGSEIISLSKKHPLKNEKGEIIGLLGISFDITERKRAEILLKQAKEQAEIDNQNKSDFVACMSHDLRTPLNGIFGAVQVLLMNKHYMDQEEFLHNIRQSANNLLFLVEDILAFAKLELGKVILNSEPFDMRILVEDVVGLIAHQANQKGLKLIVSYCDSVPCYVISDPNAIRRILINLIGNAIKFTESGHILVSVDLVAHNDDEAVAQITVEDTGIGIPKDKICAIFDRFSRINPSYSGRFQGTGLGLTIAKQLSERLGGNINVNSQLGCGSTFWCTLPLKLQVNSMYESGWHQNYADVRVLIVDDYSIRAKNIHKQLGSKNNSICASNEALDLISKEYATGNGFQIIIVDDEMLDVNPIVFASTIRQKDEYNNVMLVLFSGPKKTLSDSDKARKAGYYRQLIKPVQPKEITFELSEAWEQWQDFLDNEIQKYKKDNINILLVEDDTIAQSVSRAMLERIGCNVDIAANGSEALRMAEKEYDIIFMDIGLPDHSGLTITRKILNNYQSKSRKYKKKALIIGLTAHAFESNRRECMEAGMHSFITKPVSYDDFKLVVTNIAASHSQDAAVQEAQQESELEV